MTLKKNTSVEALILQTLPILSPFLSYARMETSVVSNYFINYVQDTKYKKCSLEQDLHLSLYARTSFLKTLHKFVPYNISRHQTRNGSDSSMMVLPGSFRMSSVFETFLSLGLH